MLFRSALSSGVQAIDTPVAPDGLKAVAQLRWTKIRGRVVAVSPETHTLLITEQEANIILVNVDENVQILRFYRVVDFDALKVQDRVELRYVAPEKVAVTPLDMMPETAPVADLKMIQGPTP